MLNGRYFSLFLSITIHLVLLFVLLSFPSKISPVISANKKIAIQSYLYKKPIREQQVKIKENKVETSKKIANKQEINAQVLSKKSSITKKIVTTNKIKETTQQNRKRLAKAQSTETKKVKKVDAIEQLANLKSQLNRQILQEEFLKYQRPQALSAMGVLPKPVPHVKIPEDDIIKKEKSTTNYASDIAIIKLDDGQCILKQDLSTVGMAGVTAVSGFNCGRTKIEKSFSDHMDKVLKKLGKK